MARDAGRRPPPGAVRARTRRSHPPGRWRLFLGEPAAPGTQRLVAPGRPADLALLRAGPLDALHSLGSDLVAATFIGGELAYARG